MGMLQRVLIGCTFAVLAIVAGDDAWSATGDPVLLNEILASHTGTDDNEYIELFGTPGISLGGLSLIVVEGDAGASAGTIDRRIDFTANHKLGTNGFFLIGNPSGLAANYGVVPDFIISANFLENSSLTVALAETASLVGSSVTSTEIARDALALTDGGAGDQFYFGAPVIGPDGSFFPAGARRISDGVDTDTAADWVLADFNLGSANTPTSGGAGTFEPVVATIMEIQGSGQVSPLVGTVVQTSGVVTLISANGRDMWIQDPAGDGDPATSDGIVVDDLGFATPQPEVGNLIQLVALVEEQQFGNSLPLTRLDSPTAVEILTSGNQLPGPVPLIDLPDLAIPDGIDFWEPLEGMRVAIDDGRVVAPTSGFGEFAMLTQADAKPGSGYLPQTKQVLVRDVGDEQVDYNPERILVDDTSLDEPIVVRPGDRVRELVGVVDYTFSSYKLQPDVFDLKTHRLPRPPASRRSGPPGGTVITTFNVENLFDLVDNPDKDDEGNTPSPEALETQLAKLALAIELELRTPEIIVVQEAENTAIIQELANLVKAATGTNYTATSFETSDGRGIEVGFLWDADRVGLLDAFQMSGPDVEGAFGPSSPSPGREPLVGRFEIEGTEITIIGNHFKSKSGDDPLYGVVQPPVRSTEVQRKAQAQVVRDFVDGLLEDDPNAMVMVTGDLNDFQFSEPGEGSDHPIAILKGLTDSAPLVNLIDFEKEAERYTFIFEGNSEVLDHMLVSPALLERFVAVDVLHFNAGFPAALGADATTPLRASDHDPVEGRFRFDGSPSM